jgi:hypothetical protein
VVAAVGIANGGAPAFAAVESPGLLRTGDLPGGVQQVGGVQTFPNLNSEVVDEKTCALRPRPFAGARSVNEVDFGPAGASAGQAFLTERVVSFSAQREARRSFARESASHAKGLRCGLIDFAPSDSSDRTLRFGVEKMQLSTIGQGSFAERTVPTNGVPATISVTFISGPYLVIIAARDSDGAPSTAVQLTAIAKRAQKRLTVAPTI